MIRREKTTIFLDATEETKVIDLKKKLEGITKKTPEDQKLYNLMSKEALDDNKTLGDCGYKAQQAKAQDPATIGLAYRISKSSSLYTLLYKKNYWYSYLIWWLLKYK